MRQPHAAKVKNGLWGPPSQLARHLYLSGDNDRKDRPGRIAPAHRALIPFKETSMKYLIPWDLQHQENRQLAGNRRNPSDWERLFGSVLHPTSAQRRGHGMPLELTETDEQIVLQAEVPGVAPEDLDISITGKVLTLAAEKRGPQSGDGADSADGKESQAPAPHYSERSFGSLKRTVELSSAVDLDSVRAEHKYGVVTITLRKADAVRPKRIEVQAS